MTVRASLATVVALLIGACGPSTPYVEFEPSELEDDTVPPEEKREPLPRSTIGRAPREAGPSCVDYCARVMEFCTGEHALYTDAEHCLGTCRDAPWAPGAPADRAGDSLYCRTNWAEAARTDPRLCGKAGPVSAACNPELDPVGEAPPLTSRPQCVLGLYDSTDGKSWGAGKRARDVMLGKRVAPVIEGLGLNLRTHDLSTGIPKDTQVRDCRAIVTVLYDNTLKDAAYYAQWLAANLNAGRRVVILNEFGAYQDAVSKTWLVHGEINRVLGKLGVRYDGRWADSGISVREADRTMFVRVPKRPGHYYRFGVTKPDVTVHLEAVRKNLTPGESAVVFTSPRGGMALTRYVESRDGAQLLDMKAFLTKALGG